LINGYELRLNGIIERDVQENNLQLISETKSQQINGNDSISIPSNRQQEPGVIRYICNGIESTIQFLPTDINNTSALYYGDKVKRKKEKLLLKYLFKFF
jgi:hypothetical protein